MSDYKRLFSYLYFYKQDVKEKNSGFAKVEIRNNQCRVLLSAKGSFLNQAARWGVYGFRRGTEGLELWRLGWMNTGNGQGEWGGQMPLDRFLGDVSDINQVAGLLIYAVPGKEEDDRLPDLEKERDGLICATVWDDLPLFMAREVLHAAQVDEPDGWEAESVEPAQGEPEAQVHLESAEAACDTQEEWDALSRLLEEKEVEKIMAVFGPPKPPVEPEISEPEQESPLWSESEEREPLQPKAGREAPQQPEAEQRVSSEPELNRERFWPEPKEYPKFWPEPKKETCPESRPESEMKEGLMPEVDREVRQAPPAPEPEVRQEQPRSQNESAPDQKRRCPCPDQCIWSDLYQEPPKNLWEKLASFYPKIILAGMGNDWEVLKIMPRDIGRLPRENWVYGNNSFLLHGYYRHHHLILACYRGAAQPQYYLGVPGSCCDRERVMASMFGFTNYLPNGRKGYWYTPVNLGNN